MVGQNEKFTFIDLFAGIGGMRIAAQNVGGNCVFSSEINNFAKITYNANFSDEPYGDITKISPKDIPNHDILFAGFPCQTFSIIGNGKGFSDTRGTLFFEIEKILAEKKPAAFVLENVRGLVKHNKGKTFSTILNHLKNLNYHVYWKILNAMDFGLPQKRERVIIVGFRENHSFNFPKKVIKPLPLSKFLEDDKIINKKHFASEHIIKKRLEKVKGKIIPYPSIWHENKGGNIGVNTYSCALRAGGSYNYLLVNGIRRLTPREFLNLQGFPRNYKIVVSDAQISRQAGNSVPIPMIQAVTFEVVKALRSDPFKSSQISINNQTNMTAFEIYAK